MIEQGTIKQRQLEEQIIFLQLTLASLQARQNLSLDLVEGSESMPDDDIPAGREATPVETPLAIAAG